MTIRKQKNSNENNLWLECAKRGILNDPFVKTVLQQLSINTQDSECYKIIADAIHKYDVRELLAPEPFRKSNPKHKDRITGEINLGVVRHTGAQYGINSHSLTVHICIVGRNGGGKTFIIKHILRNLLERKKT